MPETVSSPGPRRSELPALLYLRALADPDAEHAPRFSITHPYVEQCWLPILGPSTTWCLRHLGAELDAHPDGTPIELGQLARELGVSKALGPRSTLSRAIERLVDFHLARFSDQDSIELRTTLPPIGERSLARLSEEGQAAHRRLVAAARHDLEGHAAERGIGNPLLAAALDYAAHDLAVLPLRPKDKAPHGLLVPHGLRDATTDPERLVEWWRRVPGANVGIRTGASPYGQGLDVIDLDSEEATRAFAERAPERVAPGLLVKTARGWHLWFAASELPSRTALAEGIDVRGEGGYVVAPPSVHPSGATYRLVDPGSGAILERLPAQALPPVPEWLAGWCRPDPHAANPDNVTRLPIRLSAEHYVRVAIERECADVASTPEGARNHRLNRAAFSLGTLVGADHLDADVARAHLLDAALRAGLDERESLRTIASGLIAGERQPRQHLEFSPSSRAAGQDHPSHTPERGRAPDPPGRPVDRAEAAVLARARGEPSRRPITRSPFATTGCARRAQRHKTGAWSMSTEEHLSREEQLEQAHHQLERAVEQLVGSEDWRAMLACAARFHDYSLRNILLLQIQCQEKGIERPTRFAGYRAWQGLGRQVRRGEHGMGILARITRRERVEADDTTLPRNPIPTTTEWREIFLGYKIVKVFELSQTEGPALPDVSPKLLDGDAPAALFAGLAREVQASGFALLREDCSPAYGRTDFVARTVTVRPDCPPAQAAKTLAHELGHVRLHDEPRFIGQGGSLCRGLAEVEAESVAFLVCATAGLPTDGYSFPYVARWAKGDVELVRSAGERSLGAAREISRSLGLIAPARDNASERVVAASRAARPDGARRRESSHSPERRALPTAQAPTPIRSGPSRPAPSRSGPSRGAVR